MFFQKEQERSQEKNQITSLAQDLGISHGVVAEKAKTGALQLDETEWPIPAQKLRRKLHVPSQGRLYYIRYAFKLGWSLEQVHDATHIDPWFLDQIHQLIEFEQVLISHNKLQDLPRDVLFKAKQLGYCDAQLACIYLGHISSETILEVRGYRQSLGIEPVFKLVDTCSAEFEAATPYYYSTYESPITNWGSDKTTTVYDNEIRLGEVSPPYSFGQISSVCLNKRWLVPLVITVQ